MPVAPEQPREFRLLQYMTGGFYSSSLEVDVERLSSDLQAANDRGESVGLWAEHGMFAATTRHRGEGGQLVMTNNSLSGPWRLNGWRMFFGTAREALLMLLNLNGWDEHKPNYGFLVVKIEEFVEPKEE